MPDIIWSVVIAILILLTALIYKVTPVMFIFSAYIALDMDKDGKPFDEQVKMFIIFGLLFTLVLEPAIMYIYNKIKIYINKKYKRKKKIIKVEPKKKKKK